MGSFLRDLFTEGLLYALRRKLIAPADERYKRAIHEDCEEGAAIEHENHALFARTLGGRTGGLADDTDRVLVHIFNTQTKEERDVRTMAKKLAMDLNVLQYHIDQLEEADLVDKESGKYLYGRVCWALTRKGRKRVVEGLMHLW